MKTQGVIQKVSLIISKKLVIKVKIHLFIFREQEEYKKKKKREKKLAIENILGYRITE